MKMPTNDVLAEMRSQIRNINPFQSIKPTQAKNTAGVDFSNLLSDAIKHVNQLQMKSGDLATRLDMGDSKVTLSDTVIAREKASVAFSATMGVRNKFIEAYESIMRMSI